jgi:hypothetical protein
VFKNLTTKFYKREKETVAVFPMEVFEELKELEHI